MDAAMSNKPCRSQATPCFDTVKNTSRSKEDTDNMLTDRTEQVTLNLKQSLKKIKEINTINTVLWVFNALWRIAVHCKN